MAIYDLSKLVLFILFVAHFFCCWFNIIANIQIYNGIENTWQNKILNIDSTFDKYVASLYWAIVTMITIGYGDICPVSTRERIFVIFMALLSCGVFAYSVNAIGSIIQNITKKNSDFKAQMGQLKQYMKSRGMSLVLQMKVKKYFEYLHAESMNSNENCCRMIETLPKSLKNEVQLDIYIRLLQSQKSFSLNFSIGFLKELSLNMKEMRIGVDEIIFNQNEKLDKIYFLMHGEVQQFIKLNNQQDRIFRIYKPGSIIGRIPFFTGFNSEYSIRAINVAQLVYLTKSDFLEIIQKYQQDFEKYHKMKDQYVLNSNLNDIGSSCPACGAFNHYFTKCPFINYLPNKAKIFRKIKINEEKEQERQYYKRQDKKFASAQCTQSIIKDCAIQYILNHQEDVDYLKDIDDIQIIMEYIEQIEKYHQIDDSIFLENSLFLEDQLDNMQNNNNGQPSSSQSIKRETIQKEKSLENRKTITNNSIPSLPLEEKLAQNSINSLNNRRVSYQRDQKRKDSRKILEEYKQQLELDKNQIQISMQNNDLNQQEKHEYSNLSINLSKQQNEPNSQTDLFIIQQEHKNDSDNSNKSSLQNFSKTNLEQQKSIKSQFSMNKQKTSSIQREKTINYRTFVEGDVINNQNSIYDFSSIANFDKYFEWIIYYPNYNIQKVLNKINEQIDKINQINDNLDDNFLASKKKFVRKKLVNKILNLQLLSQEDSERLSKYNQYIERDKEQTLAQLRQKNNIQPKDSQQFKKDSKRLSKSIFK